MVRFKNTFFRYVTMAVLPLVVAACGMGDADHTAGPSSLAGTAAEQTIQVQEGSLVVTSEALDEEMVRRIGEIDSVSRVDAYLEAGEDQDLIVGVSAGSPLRVGGKPVRLITGRGLTGAEGSVAIPGIGVNADPYGFGMTGSSMAHRFQMGQSFELRGERLRVVGLYEAERDELEGAIFVPLTTAQQLYRQEGKVTTVVVTVLPERLDQVWQAIQDLLEEDQ